MKRIHLAVLVIVGLFTLGAIGTGIAAAEETKILPTPTAEAPITGTVFIAAGGQLWQLGGTKVECTRSGSGNFSFTSLNLGTGSLSFKGCKATKLGITAACTGVGDTTEVILTNGTVHFWLALEMVTATTTTLVGAIVILQPRFHFTCEALGIKELILVQGCGAVRVDNPNVLTTMIRLLAQQWVTGETKILEVLPENATREINCLLESAGPFREGTEERFTLSSLVGEALLEQFLQNNRSITVLFHNPEGH